MRIEKAVILLGSDIESRKGYIDKAVAILNQEVGTLVNESSFYESEPWGFESDTIFLNKVIVLKSTLAAGEMLRTCLDIEKRLGRKRKQGKGYSSRTIDIDILYLNNRIIKEDDLIVPHPRLHERRFTLLPLTEVLPDFIHPVLKKTQRELLESCQDHSRVVVFNKSEDAL